MCWRFTDLEALQAYLLSSEARAGASESLGSLADIRVERIPLISNHQLLFSHRTNNILHVKDVFCENYASKSGVQG